MERLYHLAFRASIKVHWHHNMEAIKQRATKTLNWAQGYLQTDLIYLAKGGSVLGIGQVVSSGVAFLLSIAFANLFPPESYGLYKYILSVVGVVTAFSLTGMDSALSQAVARGYDGTFKESYRTTFRWTLLTALITLGVAGYYFLNHNAPLGWGLIIAALAMPLLKSSLLFSGFLVGKKDFKRRVTYGMLYDIIPALCIIASLFFTNNPVLIVAVYFIAYTSIAVILYKKTQKQYPLSGAIDPETQRYSFHLSAMNILGTISFQMDKVLAFHYLGTVQLALYSFATGMPQQLKQIQKILSTLVFPRFAAHTFSNIKKDIHRKALILFLTMIPVVGLYILAAPFLFEFLFPAYVEAVPYSQVIALSLLFSPAIFYQQALTAHKQRKALYTIQSVGSSVRIILLLVLIPLYGIWGIVGALFINEVVRLALVLYFVAITKSTNEPLADIAVATEIE